MSEKRDKRGESWRILGVDFGQRRIGLAVSDPLRMTAQGLPTVNVTNETEALSAVVKIAREYDVSEIVIGLPLRLDGTQGEGALQVLSLADSLRESLSIRVVVWDERLSSVEARRILIEAGEKTGTKKGRVDRIAATILLQSYLDRKGMSREDK
ncbi:MAG: Holliday junction resolvase RuvX [Candidatus Eisenbacteria bacterium]|nr:Holliday junction resolvase RuvX [Candidatus Eisenbacteria bacterium]